jgi:GH25 family lysozyme M1 (1,4-beta-N-acetylmuramidase)
MVASLIATVIAIGPLATGKPKRGHPAKHGHHAKHRHKSEPGEKVPGIDVSTYQGRIDWRAVASTRVRFAMMRSSLGNQYVDERYRQNLTGAHRNGIVVGAYHFAKPGPGPWDARREADHFLQVARNAPGDLLPVLDIEDSGGLTMGELRSWALTWLRHVNDRTGLKAMIYSGNTFWRTRMGNTPFFAKRGHPLWVAHWNVANPEVPGRLWGRRGWTLWQRSATGRVAGISGDVDRNWFKGATLGRGRIASVRLTPSAGGVITGERLSCGGARSDCVRLANPNTRVTLTATADPDASFIRWTGACAPAGTSPTCRVSAGDEVTVSAVFEPADVVPDPASEADPAPDPSVAPQPSDEPDVEDPPVQLIASDDGAARCPEGSGCSASPSSTPEAAARRGSSMPRHVDDREARYGWGREGDGRAIGGSYRWERRQGGSATFNFTGNTVTLFTMSGPAMGRARVTIDGSPAGAFDGYSRSVSGGERHRFTRLGPGDHALTVTALGTGRPAAKGTRVAVDALRWGGELDVNPVSTLASWATGSDPGASGGSYAVSDGRGADAKLWFAGTNVWLRALRGPKAGRAGIRVDGEFVRTVDLYAATSGFASIPIAKGLTEGPHVVQVVVLGSHRRASQGNTVAIDRWVVDRAPRSVA